MEWYSAFLTIKKQQYNGFVCSLEVNVAIKWNR